MRRSRRRGRAGLITAAVAFARSPQGQRLIAEARRRYDTPENRARLRQVVRDLQSRARGGAPGGAQGGAPGGAQGGAPGSAPGRLRRSR